MGPDSSERKRGCVVVPAYAEAGRVGAVVREAMRYLPAVIVVDDGSPDDTAREAGMAGATVIRHVTNQGKGAALITGFQAARAAGFDYVVTMDGDGQHAAEDLPAFVRAYAEGMAPVLTGNRMGDTRAMPLVRRLTNRFMSWLLSRRIGQWIPDTQCGYRLYDLAALSDLVTASGGYAAESELLMALSARGVAIGSIPVRTIYGTEHSKIRPVRDSIRFFRMLRRFRNARQDRSRPISGSGRR
jgi:glycosyltransferase involved in cell wall biosynthesis